MGLRNWLRKTPPESEGNLDLRITSPPEQGKDERTFDHTPPKGYKVKIKPTIDYWRVPIWEWEVSGPGCDENLTNSAKTEEKAIDEALDYAERIAERERINATHLAKGAFEIKGE